MRDFFQRLLERDAVGWIKTYYWSTFVFLLLDKVFGIDIRVAGFIDHPGLKNLYYVFCFGCLGLILWKPKITFLVGLVESAINIAVLCIGIMSSVYGVSTMDGVSTINFQKVINFIISGMICSRSFYACQDRLLQR